MQLANDAGASTVASVTCPACQRCMRSYCYAVRQAARRQSGKLEGVIWRNDMSIHVSWYLIVSAIIFTIGVTGVLIRRNPLIIFMSIELMLNAVNLSFIAFSHYLNSVDGQMFVFLVLTVAAAEVVVGLAIIVSIFRTRRDIDVDDMNILRG
jgi:NADH-quinone oxidoreductase subunit K